MVKYRRWLRNPGQVAHVHGNRLYTKRGYLTSYIPIRSSVLPPRFSPLMVNLVLGDPSFGEIPFTTGALAILIVIFPLQNDNGSRTVSAGNRYFLAPCPRRKVMELLLLQTTSPPLLGPTLQLNVTSVAFLEELLPLRRRMFQGECPRSSWTRWKATSSKPPPSCGLNASMPEQSDLPG